MILSATFDEQILKSLSIDAWLEYCVTQNIQALEFSPDPSVLAFEVYKTLVKKQRKENIGLTFHVPYFAKYYDSNAINYDLTYHTVDFSNFKKKYETLLDYILLSEQETQLTLHGAKVLASDGPFSLEKSRDRTWSGLDYLLNNIERRKMPLTLNIELSGPESPTYLTQRNQLIETIEKFRGSALKICWDLTHDYHHQPEVEKPSDDFLKAIGHVHIHGVNEAKEKHMSLQSSILNFDPAMQILNDISYSHAVVLEILMHSFAKPEDYLKTLTGDLKVLSNLIK